MSANYKVGKIYFISPTYNITTKKGKVIARRDLFLSEDKIDSRTQEVTGTNYVKFEMGDTRFGVLDNFKVGDKVAVLYEIDGYFYDGGKTTDGNTIWKHVQNVTAFNVISFEEYKKRFDSKSVSEASQAVDFISSINRQYGSNNAPQNASPTNVPNIGADAEGERLPF